LDSPTGLPVQGRLPNVIIVRKAVADLSEATLSRFVRRAARAIGLRGEVNVLLTTNRQMKSLNWRFRIKNVATDVLSFVPDSKSPARYAGDIAISAEMAAKNGRRLGHSPAEEVKILVVHGLLHLAGYDHERDNGAMARKEQQLRIRLDLPHGLIERSDRSTGMPSKRNRLTRRVSAQAGGAQSPKIVGSGRKR
jgi:probable rRNA maturation factor